MTYPPGPPQPAGQPAAEPGPASTPPTNTKATSALVVGISTLVLSWCCGLGLAGLVAVVLGVKARSEIRASAGTQGGEGVALAGIVTGAVAVVVGLLVLVAVILLVASGNAAFQGYADSTG